MSALLFKGQGSQIVGMGSEFYNKFKIVKEIFSQADKKLNQSISKIILEGPSDELQLTKNTQPAILTVSYSIFKTLKDEFNLDLKDSVMASDAFFPFPDCVELAKKSGITSVIQPGGSIKDNLSIEFCDENNMSMVMTGTRHFKH